MRIKEQVPAAPHRVSPGKNGLARVTMTIAQRKRLRALLQAQHEELAKHIQAHTVDLVIGESEPDPSDQIQVSNQRDEAVINLSRLSRMLAHVDCSLAMPKDAYGVCVACGKAIPFKRLRAIPWASHCVECQEHLEFQESAYALDRASSHEGRETA